MSAMSVVKLRESFLLKFERRSGWSAWMPVSRTPTVTRWSPVLTWCAWTALIISMPHSWLSSGSPPGAPPLPAGDLPLVFASLASCSTASPLAMAVGA